MNEDDGYDELFVEDRQPREKILNAVKPFLRFTEDGEIIEQDAYDNLGGKEQVLVLLLGTKVLQARGLRDEEGLRVAEIVDKTGMQESTIEKYVYGRLKDAVKSDNGRIFVPNYKVGTAAQDLGVEDNGQG